MLVPEPRLARKVSQGASFLSQSAALAESSSSSRLPVRRRMVDLSLGWGGLGLVDDAQVVFRESSDFLDKVSSSYVSSSRSRVLMKLMSTCRHLISSLFRIRIWEYDELGGGVWVGSLGGVCAAATRL